MKALQRLFSACFLLSTFIFGISCSDDEAVPYKGNYFPMIQGGHWTYEQKWACDGPNDNQTCVEIVQAEVLNKTLEWDRDYKAIQHPAGFQFVKIKDSEYFGTGYYLTEYKFLDDELRAGGKWGDEDEFTYQRFEIAEVNAVKKIKGKTYNNVIVVNQETSYSGDPVITNVYHYAKDIGLIYRQQTVTYKDRNPEVMDFSLINYSIFPL